MAGQDYNPVPDPKKKEVKFPLIPGENYNPALKLRMKEEDIMGAMFYQRNYQPPLDESITNKWVFRIPDEGLYLYYDENDIDFNWMLVLDIKGDMSYDVFENMNPSVNYAQLLVALLNEEFDPSMLGQIEPDYIELVMRRLATLTGAPYGVIEKLWRRWRIDKDQMHKFWRNILDDEQDVSFTG